jgi:hypothetical protein
MEAGAAYPVALAVDYPERQSRWKTLFRLFLAIPLLIFAYLINSASLGMVWAIWIVVALRGRIPRWMFDFQVALIGWQVRAFSYCLLLTDAYAPFEGDYPIRFEAQYPERLSRWKVLFWKYFTVLPHSIVLFFLWIAAYVVLIIAWFAILFTGRFPRALHGYVAGVVRWSLRVQAYVFSLTDEYPPFSFSAEAGPAGRDTYVVSSVIGWLLGAGLNALLVGGAIAAVNMRETVRVNVSYADLTAGHVSSEETKVDVRNMDISLTSAMDPADEAFNLVLGAGQNKHLVAFRLRLSNNARISRTVRESDFELKDSNGKRHDPLLAAAGGRLAPVKFKNGTTIDATVIFEIGDDARPEELRCRTHFLEGKRVIYEFE